MFFNVLCMRLWVPSVRYTSAYHNQNNSSNTWTPYSLGTWLTWATMSPWRRLQPGLGPPVTGAPTGLPVYAWLARQESYTRDITLITIKLDWLYVMLCLIFFYFFLFFKFTYAGGTPTCLPDTWVRTPSLYWAGKQ